MDRHLERLDMKLCTAATLAVVAALPFGAQPSRARYAVQLNPYCALSTSTGGQKCYIRSREECGSNCISNPWYIGAQRARPYLDGRRTIVPHEVRP
jgi:hypothetical protein